MTRKTPIRHKVRSYKRKDGTKVSPYTRGKGERRRLRRKVVGGSNTDKFNKPNTGKGPTKRELDERDWDWAQHHKLLSKNDANALRLHNILEECYPPDPKVRGPDWYRWEEMYQKKKDLYGALTQMGPLPGGFENLTIISNSFKKWGVEDALDCPALKEIFRSDYGGELGGR